MPSFLLSFFNSLRDNLYIHNYLASFSLSLSLVKDVCCCCCCKLATNLTVEDHDCFLDEVLEDHVAEVNLDLVVLELVVEPEVLALHDLVGESGRQPSLPCLLKQLLVEDVLLAHWRLHYLVVLHDVVLPLEDEDRGGLAARVGLDPAEHVLLHHEEEPLRVDRARVHLGLQAPVSVAPRHGLALKTIRSKLYEALVQCIEHRLVVDVRALLDH